MAEEQRSAESDGAAAEGAGAGAPAPASAEGLRNEVQQLRSTLAELEAQPPPAVMAVAPVPHPKPKPLLGRWSPTKGVHHARLVLFVTCTAFWIYVLVTFLIGTAGQPNPPGSTVSVSYPDGTANGGAFAAFVVDLFFGAAFIALGFACSFHPYPLIHLLQELSVAIALPFLGIQVYFDASVMSGSTTTATGSPIYATVIARIVGELLLGLNYLAIIGLDAVHMNELGKGQDGTTKYRAMKLQKRAMESGLPGPYVYYPTKPSYTQPPVMAAGPVPFQARGTLAAVPASQPNVFFVTPNPAVSAVRPGVGPQ